MKIINNIQTSQVVTRFINHSSCNTSLKARTVAAHIFSLITHQAEVPSLNSNKKINELKKIIQNGSLLETELIPHETPTYQALKDVQKGLTNGESFKNTDLELLFQSILGYLEEPKDKMQFNQLLAQHVEKPT